jgi:hypothetical protein
VCEYTGPDEEEMQTAAAISETADIFMDQGSRFYRFRAALDKNIKNKNDAMCLLDAIEDRAESNMKEGVSPVYMAELIGMAETVRTDIMREMNHNRALRRMYLESH